MNKRILFITPGLARGGAETQLMKVVRYLRSHGKEVMIIALKPINDFKHIDFEAEGIKVIFLKGWKTRFLSNTLQLFKMVRQFQPQVVIAFMFIAVLFARVLKLRYKFHLISSIRSSVISKKWRKAFKLTSGLDDVVIYNSQASKQNFETQSLARKNGIIINNAISIPAAMLLENVETKPKPFIWVTMAHFRPAKDYVTLFKAMALLRNENVRLDCLGYINESWPYEMLEELAIKDKVRILGFKSNTGDYLREADGFVLSTFGEGSPNSMLEAMSYYKPIVASAVDGVKEFLPEAGCGFLAEPLSPEDLAKQMLKVMNLEKSELNKLARKGREYVETNFSEDMVLEKWLQVVC